LGNLRSWKFTRGGKTPICLKRCKRKATSIEWVSSNFFYQHLRPSSAVWEEGNQSGAVETLIKFRENVEDEESPLAHKEHRRSGDFRLLLAKKFTVSCAQEKSRHGRRCSS
jgi:hypothetical protein